MTDVAHKAMEKQIAEAQSATFSPVAYYDQHMDLIRIELRDCSTWERRINQFLTLAFDNYPEEGQSPVAGLTFKGVKHLFKQWNLRLEGVYLLAELLDRIVKESHLDSDAKKSLIPMRDFLANTEMRVSVTSSAA